MKSMVSKLSCLALATIFCLLAGQGAAWAETRLTAPQAAARGDAFMACAESDRPVKGFVFFWRGGSYAARAAEGPEGLYRARILLPVPLEEKASRLSLGLGVAAGAKGGALEEANADISLFDRKRPVQKLTVDKKYVDPPASEKERIKADRAKVKAALAHTLPDSLWELPLLRPVPGSVSSLFGLKRVFNGQPRGMHRGLDLRGATGTPVKACADGKVALVDNLYFSGNTVYINHGGGVFSAYLHMSEARVTPGQTVRAGDVIGLVGSTGRVTGPHLHLSLYVQGQAVDPLPLLEKTRETARSGGTTKTAGKKP